MNQLLRLIVILSCAVITDTTQADWFTGQYDGSVLPQLADPQWKCSWLSMPQSQATDGILNMVVPLEKGGHVYVLDESNWDATGKDLTVEFRAWIVDTDEIGLRFNVCNGKQSWLINLVNSEKKDILRIRNLEQGKNKEVRVDDGFVTVRICIRSQYVGVDQASVFVNDEKVAEHWSGFGTKDQSALRIGDGSGSESEAGTIAWDYIRWNIGEAVPPSSRNASLGLDMPQNNPNPLPIMIPEVDTEAYPQITLPTVNTSPKIDGKLDDKAWESASRLELHPWRQGDHPARDTQVKLCTDGQRLYVAFICEAPENALKISPKAGRDHYFGGSDTVELFLDTALDRSNYYQIALNINNTLFDAFRDAPAWNGEIKHATLVNDRQWIAELSINLDSLDRTSQSPVWGLNVNHVQSDTGAMMTWAPIKTGHHEPDHFGFALFIGNQADLSQVLEMTQQAKEIYSNLQSIENSQAYATQLALISHQLEQLQQSMASAGDTVDTQRYMIFRRQAQALLGQTTMLQQQIDTRTSFRLRQELVANKPYAVVPMDSLTKIGQTFWPPVPLPEQVSLMAAKGESESFQLVIVNGSRTMHTGRVRPLPLRMGDKAIEVSDMKLWSVQSVSVETPSKNSMVKPKELVPDPLVPSDAFTIAAGEHQAVWVTIHVPRDAQAGQYTGKFEIYAPGFPLTTVPISLEVMDFVLPIRPQLRTSFGLWGKKGIDFAYELERDSPEFNKMYELYAQVLLDYRLTPREWPGFDPSNPQAYDDWVQRRLAQGANILTMRFDSSPPSWLRAFTDHLMQKGWFDMLYVRPGDEPEKEHFAKIKKEVHNWREVVPSINMQIAGNQAACNEMIGTVNVWCPLTSGFDPQWSAVRQAKGEEAWWYVCNVPPDPYANFQIDQQAICHRVLFWQTYIHHIDGLLYWNVINYRGGDPWRITPYWSGSSGDGALLYPGNRGPLPSIRLEVIRDGMEDYDYLAILAKCIKACEKMPEKSDLVQRAKAALSLNDLYGDLRRYSRDRNTLLTRRKRIAQLIVQLGQN